MSSIFERYIMYMQFCELAGIDEETAKTDFWFSLPNWIFISLADTQPFCTSTPEIWNYPEDKSSYEETLF